MTTPLKFHASYLKLNRAVKHLDELRAEVEAYLAREPVTFCWEPISWVEELCESYSRDAELIGLVPRVRLPIPETLAPIIGDVVHNLRSALDIMMFDLIAADVPEDQRRHISFPFWTTESGKKRAMQHVTSKPKIASLVYAWEPHPNGRSRLGVLHDLWNADKHRTIIPMMSGVEFSEAQALFGHTIDGERVIDPFPVRKQVRDGRPYIVQQVCDIAPPFGTKIPCVVRLAIDGESSIRGRELIQELQSHCDVVRCVLESFENGEAPTYSPPPPPGPVRVGHGQWMFPPSMTPKDVDEWLDKNWQQLY